MTAPESSTLMNMTGRWIVDSSLSDDFGAILALQGVPLWKRQALGMIAVTEHIAHIHTEGKTHSIHIEQQITGGFQGGEETIVVDGLRRPLVHPIFGSITESASWSDLSDIDDEWLREGWRNSTEEPDGKLHLNVTVVNESLGWELNVIWGFILIDGKRYHCRRMSCRKGDQFEKVRCIYRWVD